MTAHELMENLDEIEETAQDEDTLAKYNHKALKDFIDALMNDHSMFDQVTLEDEMYLSGRILDYCYEDEQVKSVDISTPFGEMTLTIPKFLHNLDYDYKNGRFSNAYRNCFNQNKK